MGWQVLGMVSLNNFSGLCGVGAAPNCLMLGPRVIMEEELCLMSLRA